MNDLTLFIKLDLGHQKMFFFLDWLDRSPLAVKQFFGINFIHCYSSITTERSNHRRQKQSEAALLISCACACYTLSLVPNYFSSEHTNISSY